jgi:PAS domain S-box-containing protein
VVFFKALEDFLMAEKPTYEALEQRVKALEKEVAKCKQIEEALRESEKKYSRLVEDSLTAIYIDQDGRIAFANGRFAEIYGYSRDEVVGMESWRLVHPEDRALTNEIKERRLKGQEAPLEYEARGLTKGGGTIWVERRNKRIDYKEEPAILGNIVDITERKRAEYALRDSEAQKQAILDACIDKIRYVDEDMKIIWANETTATAHDIPPQDLVGRTCYELFFGRDTPCEGCPTIKAKETGQAERAVMHHPNVKGIRGETYWDTRCVPLKNEAGDIEGYIQMARNITDEKRAEERIRTLSQELMKVQEKERQRISRDLHDRVAQDLSTLKIGCETLFDDQPIVPSDIRERVSQLSKIIEGSIKDVRNLAYALRPPSLDQLGLVQTVSQYCEDFSDETGVSADFYSAGMDNVKPDLDTQINLYRLIQEALSNVRKHADASRASVRLVPSFPNIILRIEDDGRGFDVAARLAAAHDEKRLGLLSMKERVALLGGTMEIQSRPGQGTKIFIELPYGGKYHGQ